MYLLSIASLFQNIIDCFASLGQKLLNFLPLSPFVHLSKLVIANDVIMLLNYVIPFNFLITITEAWLIAISSYYIYMVVLKWVKVSS